LLLKDFLPGFREPPTGGAAFSCFRPLGQPLCPTTPTCYCICESTGVFWCASGSRSPSNN